MDTGEVRTTEAALPGHSRGLWMRSGRRLLRKPKAIFAIAIILLLYGGGVLAIPATIARFHTRNRSLA